jgi:hypothetical protein
MEEIKMSTPRDLGKKCWQRCIQLWTFNGALEDYVVITTAKLGALAVGIAIGYYWL